MRRKDREMGTAFGWKVLERCQYGVIATIEEDGSPYCMPVHVACRNGEIFFHCACEGRRTDNLRRDARVCLTAVGEVRIVPEALTTGYESVVVRGQAEEVLDRDEKYALLELLCQRYAPGFRQESFREIKACLDITAVWRVLPKEITAKRNRRSLSPETGQEEGSDMPGQDSESI